MPVCLPKFSPVGADGRACVKTQVLPYLLEQPGIEASYGMRDAKYGRTPLAEACAKGNLEPAIALLSSPLFHPPVATLDEKDKMGEKGAW
jgi:hypothetical protein